MGIWNWANIYMKFIFSCKFSHLDIDSHILLLFLKSWYSFSHLVVISHILIYILTPCCYFSHLISGFTFWYGSNTSCYGCSNVVVISHILLSQLHLYMSSQIVLLVLKSFYWFSHLAIGAHILLLVLTSC